MVLLVVSLRTCQGEKFQSKLTCSTSPPTHLRRTRFSVTHLSVKDTFCAGANNFYYILQIHSKYYIKYMYQTLDKGGKENRKHVSIQAWLQFSSTSLLAKTSEVFTVSKGNNDILKMQT